MYNRRIFSLSLSVALCATAVTAMFFLVGDPARALGTPRYVAPAGTDGGNDCTNPSNPCRTIQYAVDQAGSGDVIKVATGVYTGVQARPVPPAYPNAPAGGIITQVVYISKTVDIRGGYTAPGFADPPDPEAQPSLLDAEEQGRVLAIVGPSAGSGQAISPTIEGLRITGGEAAGLGGSEFLGDAGGGVYVISATAALSNNEVFSNTVGANRGVGGGLYLQVSDATLSGNTIVSNTAPGDIGLGGGLALYGGQAALQGNTIGGNTAGLNGGGLFMGWGAPTLQGNTFRGNTATNDRGGGIHMQGSDATLSGNTIVSNGAGTLGGGLYMRDSGATLNGNTVSGNTADQDGGGLYLRESDATLSGNTITTNTAVWSGGGLYLTGSSAALNGNTIRGNTANGTDPAHGGGGLYLDLSNGTTVNGNTIRDNVASHDGGGIHGWALQINGNIIRGNSAGGDGGGVLGGGALTGNIIRGNSAAGNGGGVSGDGLWVVNNVVAGNQAGGGGSGLYVGMMSDLRHNTVASNHGGEGSGVHVSAGTVVLYNTVLVSHTVGITAPAGSMAILDSTLWNGNTTDWGGAGSIVPSNDYSGNPAFVDPGADDYHLRPVSAALDKGVDMGVTTDIDGQPRPYLDPDLGADEYWPPCVLNACIYLPLILRSGP